MRRRNTAVYALAAGAVAIGALATVALVQSKPSSPPPESSSIVITVSPNPVLQGFPTTVTGAVTDAQGRPIVGVTGNLLDGGIPVPNSSWTSDASGMFSEAVSFNAAGDYQVQAQYAGTTSPVVVVMVTNVSSPPPSSPISPPPVSPPSPPVTLASLSISAIPNPAQVNQAITISGSARGSTGNPFAGAMGDLAEGGIVVSGSNWTSNSSGTFSLSVMFGTGGSYMVSAVSGTIESPPVTIVVSNPVSPPPTTALAGMIVPLYDGPNEVSGTQWNLIMSALAQPGVSNVPVIGIIWPITNNQATAQSWAPIMISAMQKYPQLSFMMYQSTCGGVNESDGCTYVPLATAEQGAANAAAWYNTVQSYNPSGVKVISAMFFDDAQGTVDSSGLPRGTYFAELQSYAASLGFVGNMGNVGDIATTSVIGTLPYWMVWETPGYATSSYMTQWEGDGLPAKDLSFINNGAATYSASSVQASAPYCGWMWICSNSSYADAPYASQLILTLSGQ